MPWLEDLKFPRGYQMGTHKTLKEVLQILNRNKLILNKFDYEIVVSTFEMD